MKQCCLRFLNFFKCKKTLSNSALKLIEESNLLLPKTESTRGVIERNELNTFGKVPPNIKGILDLTLYTNSMIDKIVCAKKRCLILMENKSLFCFGKNNEGQLGQSIKDHQIITSLVKLNLVIKEIGAYTIEDIAAGDNFSLLLLRSNNKNYLIRLGTNQEDKYKDSFDEIKVVHIENIPDVDIKRIIVFGKRILLLTFTNDIYIGGIDFESTILDGYILLTHFDKEINSICLGSTHCLILSKEGELYGIGDNTYCELGPGEMNQKSFKMITFKEFNYPIKKVTVGARHTLFLLDNGDLYCIGDNSENQCNGDNSRIQNPFLIDLGIKLKIIDIYSGYTHNLIILENGDILTWGNSTDEKLGYQQLLFSQATPKLILQLQERCAYNVALGSDMTVISTASYRFAINNNEVKKKI